MRYIIAVVVASLLTGAGFGVGRYMKRALIEDLRGSLRTAKAEGTLPKELEGVDIDNFTLEGWEIRLSQKAMRQIWISDWLLYGWHIWIPIVFLGSIGIAYLTSGRATPGGR